MAYIDSYTLSQDLSFLHKVQIACITAATTVITNNTPANGIPLARQILRDPDLFAGLVAQLIQIDATIAAAAPTGNGLTDVQIQTAVNAQLQKLVQ